MTHHRARRRRLTHAATVTMLGLVGVGLGATPASATTRVLSVSLSTHKVGVTGGATMPLTVSVQLSGHGCWTDPPTVGFTKVGESFQLSAPLALTAGTVDDGTWAVTIPVTASWNGAWAIRYVDFGEAGACPPEEPSAWAAPPGDPAYAVVVSGTNGPRVTYTLSPDPLPYNATGVLVQGHVALADGTPIAGAAVLLTQQEFCPDVNLALSDPLLTDAGGNFVSVMEAGPFEECATVLGAATASETGIFYGHISFSPPRLVRLTATVGSQIIKSGRYVDIVGVMGWAPPCGDGTFAGVQLQRYAAGHWRHVVATLRCAIPDGAALSGYRFHTLPPVRGRVHYRVYFPGRTSIVGGTFVRAVSRTLSVRVR